ncbi:sulfatase-like hydrolase/transferase [Haloferula sp. A504]|uniref:sulfatase-like hydrolase/transferase n=1 Tax=Haloferula sp. A504 TaxID=3373601 RepID=UPI0031CC1BD1|nr:sulfatase-like hydrolase/transferase [Verrucomicrobiaceae bacterium E54]
MKTSPLFLILLNLLLAAAQGAPKPNILYLYVDDMGWGSIGPNGQAQRKLDGLPHVLTPNIDSLADQGVNFTRAYGCTVCSPARSSQQSGFHQGHTYADRNDPDNARKAMRADDRLMGDVLSEAGYATGYWGKWGYGASQDQSNPQILNLQTLPTSHGYQDVLAELHHIRAHTFYQPTLWKAPATAGALGGLELVPNSIAAYGNNANYPETPAFQSDPGYPATSYCDDAYCFAALDFVRAQAQTYHSTGQPFFGLLAVQVPHSPYAEISQLPNWDAAYSGNAPFAGMSSEAKQWAAMVTRIDAHLGNILAALEDPNNDGDTSDSVADNTIVIFMSDNGGPSNNARSEINANGGLRGSKGSIYEGGIRVPMVIRWPAMINTTSSLQPGTNSDQPIDVTDLLPTLCDVVGVETPLGIDGVSIAPTLTGSGHQRTREYLIHEAQPNYSIIRGDMKLVGPGNALYNLATDPDESDDISGSNTALVAELSAIALAERVTEPAWSAITYHQWTGNDGDVTSDAAHWSDYEYRNALNNTVYQTDSGAPNASWIARMENSGTTPATATADADLEVLGLEVRGASTTATQTLEVGSRTLTARNELRLSAHSKLTLDNGMVRSQRRIDLREDGTLEGAGTLDTSLHSAGTLAVTESSGTTIPGSGTELLTNGGFESGSGTAFSATDSWTNLGGDQSVNARNTTNPSSGSYRGIVGNGSNGPVSPSTDTGLTIQTGDAFTLSFQHAGALNWDLGADTITATLYYQDGGDHTIGSITVTPTQDFSTGYNSASTEIAATAGSVGQSLWLRIESATAESSGEFASIDDVSLLRNGDPVTVSGSRSLQITGDYRESTGATLELTLAGSEAENHSQLLIAGSATLAGSLAVTVDPGFTPARGDSFTILTAGSLTGTYNHPEQRVTGSDGTLFDITYTGTTVTLTADATTAQGTPYSWLEFYEIDGGDHEAADLIDHDGDGMLAWEEYLAGTNPTSPRSFFAASISTASGSLEIRWPSAPGRVYRILESGDLVTPFAPFAGPFSATPPENVFPIPDGPSHRFFQIQVELE